MIAECIALCLGARSRMLLELGAGLVCRVCGIMSSFIEQAAFKALCRNHGEMPIALAHAVFVIVWWLDLQDQCIPLVDPWPGNMSQTRVCHQQTWAFYRILRQSAFLTSTKSSGSRFLLSVMFLSLAVRSGVLP